MTIIIKNIKQDIARASNKNIINTSKRESKYNQQRNHEIIKKGIKITSKRTS
jgi:hypothetical protein